MRPQAYIYTPQGRATRYMVEESNAMDISGLYTDKFSRCNVVACVSDKRLSLMHADIRTTANSIRAELEWTGNDAKLIILFRESGKPICKGFMENGLHFSYMQQVDDSVVGVVLSLNPCKYNPITTHVYTTAEDLKPAESELVHHPQEYLFLRTHKIEQVTSSVAKATLPKTIPIYSGRYWEHIRKEECEVYAPNQETKNFLKKLESCQDHFSYHSELNRLAQRFFKEDPYEHTNSLTLFGDMLETAFYFDLLFNEKLSHSDNLKKNIQAMLASDIEIVLQTDQHKCTPEDLLFIKKIEHLMVQSDAETQLNQFIKDCKNQQLNPYQEQVMRDLPKILYFYEKRIEFKQTLQTNIQESQKALNKKVSTACNLFKQGNFSAAQNLFFEALITTSRLYTTADPELASIHYSMGRTLYKLGTESRMTTYFLNSALSMTTEFNPNNTAFIQKVKSAIQEVETQQSELSSALNLS